MPLLRPLHRAASPARDGGLMIGYPPVPAWSGTQPVVSKVPRTPESVTLYSRAITIDSAFTPFRLVNSLFERRERGPIRRAEKRQPWWRYPRMHEGAMATAGVPAPVIPGPNNTAQGTPGGVMMSPQPRWKRVLRTPAWRTEPATWDVNGVDGSA